MKTKKIIAVLLAVVLVLALAACGSSKAPASTPAPTSAPESSETESGDAGIGSPEILASSVNQELREVLPGLWEIKAWDMTSGGYLNVAEGWYLEYTDDTIWFYMDGAVVNEESITWITENTIHAVYKADTSYYVDWAYKLEEDGSITITDDGNGFIYYTEKCPEGTDPTAYTPVQPAGVGEEAAAPVSPEDLVGTWDLHSMNFAGTETPVQDQTFVFTEDSVQYVVSGATVNDNTYTWTDESTLHIVSKADPSGAVDWSLAPQADGSVIITDTTNGLVYTCTKQA